MLGLASLAAAQAQTPTPAPRFRSGVDLVHLDVSVLDRNRRPVRGLTPADFTILENGKPQQIVAFNAVDIPDPEPPSTPWIRDVAPDVGTNDGVEERRLFLLLLDDAMIQSDVRAVNNVRDIARRVIDRLGPSDLAAVIFTRDNQHSQDYTADRARLLTALDKFSVGFRDMSPVTPDDLYYLYSVDVVEAAVDTLSTMPDRRKAIIYVGQGVPVDLELLAPQAVGIPEGGGESALMKQGLMQQLKNQMEKAFQRAARANVNVYTVDACGLRVTPAPPPPGQSLLEYHAPTCVPGLEVDYLKTVAANTGARAVTDTNDFAPGVTAIFEENASYYLIGYQSTDQRADGRLRRIEVRVNRPDVEVRTRNGYLADGRDAAKRKAALAASPLGAALAGVLPKSDLPLQMSAVPFAVPGRREAAVAIVLGVRQPIRTTEEHGNTVSTTEEHGNTVSTTEEHGNTRISTTEEHGNARISTTEEHGNTRISTSEEHGNAPTRTTEEHGRTRTSMQTSGGTVERVDLQVSAFNVNGKAFGSTRLQADVALRPDASGLAEYEVLARLDLKPGRYQLRVGANLRSLSTSGSLYCDVDVPDFSSAPVSLSGLVLSASPGPVVGSRDALRPILPVVPTARRAFTSGHQVSAFTRVYQGGKAALASVAVRVRLRNAANELVMDRREELAAARFTTTRSADVRVEVPVAHLAPGEYLLTVEAAARTTVHRNSRFQITR
ncbi:MAG: hypothetical protein A3H96_12385 [Acidobacteria bacterium RIFCSPLOWO2_02_FULL_67_36]|nr:MAG: hypothetical protein A3H96_12385 [Acidobacteria bacterium RIFCSPLOWO2_02_FULL_67_36]